ncbi:MAG: hypothetical protein H6632_14930 [Anaerolineales bacterium]|nr:hypothetical protein [Anaerolineales bacterium]
MAKIPKFETLDDAVEFWESHDSADYEEDLEDVQFEVDLRKNLLHPKLTVLTHRPAQCPRCQHDFDDITIEYVTSVDGRLLVIRDVPALRCQINGHEYILEKTLDEVEHLLDLQKKAQLQPTTTLNVPVFSLKTTV